MYHYAFYGYLAYKMYEYSNILEYALIIGRCVKYVYYWKRPISNQKDYGKYLDWVLIVEDKDSHLKKN